MRKRDGLAAELLKISRSLEKNTDTDRETNKTLRLLTTRLSKRRMGNRRLTADHLKVLAWLFRKTLTESGRADPLNLLRDLFGAAFDTLDRLDLVVDLIELKLLECSEKRYIKMFFGGRQSTVRLDRTILIDSYVRLTPSFLSFLLNEDSSRFSNAPKPFACNHDFVEAWFDYVDTVYLHRIESVESEAVPILEAQVIARRAELDKRIGVTKKVFPFQRLTRQYNLSHEEQVLLMFVLKQSVDDINTSKEDFQRLLRHTRFDKYTQPSIISQNSTLIKEGLILPVEFDGLILGDEGYEIAPEVASEILSDSRRPLAAIVDDIIKREDLFEIVTPTHTMTRMVLPRKTLATVRQAISRFNRNSFQTLSDWGLCVPGTDLANSSTPADNSRLVMLFHGTPGTGKTALAHALAHSMRRVLLTTDISRIIDKWVGESQKRLSRLFLLYRKILKRTGRAPVLLLNEADQLISKRGGAHHSVDRMYNQMQNILLENLETFRGILIATTNMIENFDEAFSRRFDVKLVFYPPTCSERRRLWHLLIPKGLPLDVDVDKNKLAERFHFTGAQIETVIRNAAVAAADRPTGKQKVTHADLVRYAALEESSSFDRSNTKLIGFG